MQERWRQSCILTRDQSFRSLRENLSRFYSVCLHGIYVCPAEDNTIVLGLECSMQHDGMSLDLTKYDPLNAVPGYSGWMWSIYVEKEEYLLLEGWGGDDPVLGVAGDILYIKSLNSDHTQFEIRCKFTDPLKGSLDFYYKGAVELFGGIIWVKSNPYQ